MTLSFSSILTVSIPPFLYTQTLEDDPAGYKCLILVEGNQEDSAWMDPISTEEDGLDWRTNNGYILGAPVLQSMMVLFDFERNNIGVAEKVRNYGASLVVGGGSSTDTDKDSTSKGQQGNRNKNHHPKWEDHNRNTPIGEGTEENGE